MDKIKVFVDNNLDGAGCLLILKLAMRLRYELSVVECDNTTFPELYSAYISEQHDIHYKKTIILNLHGPVSLKKGTIAIKKSEKDKKTSTMCVLEVFKSNIRDSITKSHVTLFQKIEDFYNESGIIGNSWKLHAVYCGLDFSPIKFADSFIYGLKGYSEIEKTYISEYKKSVGNLFKSMKLFTTGKNDGILVIMLDSLNQNNMIYDIINKIHHPELTFMVNPYEENMIIRKANGSNIELGSICNSFLNGLCFRNIAGGTLKPNFVEFSRRLIPCPDV